MCKYISGWLSDECRSPCTVHPVITAYIVLLASSLLVKRHWTAGLVRLYHD